MVLMGLKVVFVLLIVLIVAGGENVGLSFFFQSWLFRSISGFKWNIKTLHYVTIRPRFSVLLNNFYRVK